MRIPTSVWLWLLGSVISYGVGEYFSKRIADHFSYWFMVGIVLGYIGSGLFWIPAIRQKDALIILGLIWMLMAAVMTLSIGLAMGETLSRTQIVGVSLAITAAVLLSR